MFLVLVVALLLLLVWYFTQTRRPDVFRSRRARYREKRLQTRRDQPIDPTFQFDQPPASPDYHEPPDPN